MATSMRYLGRETRNTLVDKITNASTYEFKDSETNEVPELEDLSKKGDLTKYNSKIKSSETGDDIEWDSIVVEGLDDEKLDEQVKAICESYAKPDFTWDKDPGQGRAIQNIKVDGTRQVLYDLHKDELGNHLHLKVFRWSLNEEEKRVSSCPNDTAKVFDAQLQFTNETLEKNGLPKIGIQPIEIF